jgi:DNA-binding NarL/FixJ family response regulator
LKNKQLSDVFWGRLRDDRHILRKMNNSKPLILIVAPPGDLQIGLQALLTTHLEVDVLVTGKGSSALKVIERHNPDLVILDHDLPRNNVPMMIQQIKSIWPGIRCIVLVNDDEGRQKVWGTGAELIVIKGLPGAKLVSEIEEFLPAERLDHLMSRGSEEEKVE